MPASASCLSSGRLPRLRFATCATCAALQKGAQLRHLGAALRLRKTSWKIPMSDMVVLVCCNSEHHRNIWQNNINYTINGGFDKNFRGNHWKLCAKSNENDGSNGNFRGTYMGTPLKGKNNMSQHICGQNNY